jgi:membrane-associated phospholipid phosphatase
MLGMASAAALLLAATSVEASPSGANGPDWALGHPAGEAVVGGISALSLLAAALPQRAGAWGPSQVRPQDESVGFVSDFTGAVIGTAWQLAGGYGLEVSYYREHQVPDAYRRAWRSTLVDAESALLGLGMTYALKRLVGRCRPRAWRVDSNGAGRCDPERPEHDAFPSGHTVTVSSIAGARLVLAGRSDGASSARYGSLAFAEAASVLTGVLRVLAGAHSWEDVVGAYALGHAAGVLVAFTHPMVAAPDRVQTSTPSLAPATAVQWSGRF